jgi:hypothetical protein
MLATLRRAADRVRDTPGRRGHLVHLQGCTELFVVGDLHGHVGNFQSVWKLADLANHPGRHLVLQELVHGPFRYPNGADKSHQAVDLFAAVKCQFPDRVHYLPGNHEMGQWTGRKILKGTDDLNESFRQGVMTAYGSLGGDVYRAYVELFRLCPLGLRTDNHVFVSHTLVPGRQMNLFDPARLEAEEYEPRELQPGGVVYGILWGRDTTAETADAFARKVDAEWLVTGHIPSETGHTVPNHRQVTLDCSGSPGGYVLVPADRAITHADLVAGVGTV